MYKERNQAEDKSVLIKLLTLMLIMGIAVLTATGYLLIRREQLIVRLIIIALIAFAVTAVVFTTAALISVLLLYHGRGDSAVSGKIVLNLLNSMFVPIMTVGSIAGIGRDRIQRAYAHINNRAVFADRVRFNAEDVLLLLPHCIQNSHCKHRITGDIYNCAGCGRCKVADLVELGRNTGVIIRIVPGGTLARKVIGEIRPKAVVAVACENDLCSGIRDARALPVIGVLNRRPYGPCRDTDVDVTEVEKAIDFFIKK